MDIKFCSYYARIVIFTYCWLAFVTLVLTDSPIIAARDERVEVVGYRQRRTTDDNYDNCTNYDSKIYKNENSKSIILKLYKSLKDNPRITSTRLNDIQYWYGLPYYNKTEIKQTCVHTLDCVYPYGNNETVKSIVYECPRGTDYCCELECCTDAVWILKWYIGVPILAIVIVAILAGIGAFVWKKRAQDS